MKGSSKFSQVEQCLWIYSGTLLALSLVLQWFTS